jgi:hypothetical protein
LWTIALDSNIVQDGEEGKNGEGLHKEKRERQIKKPLFLFLFLRISRPNLGLPGP